jgi:hypothetical protein
LKLDSGWIFGVCSKHQLSDNKRFELENLLPQFNQKLVQSQFCIYFSHNKNTFYNLSKNWIINGVGISDNSSTLKLMQQEDWEEYFIKPDSVKVTGNFLKFIWTDQKINIQSDLIGLKTLYILKDESEVYFSTNLKLITGFIKSPQIDFSAFGAKWLLFNQLECRSFIKNIDKLTPNSELIIENGDYKVNCTNYQFTQDEYSSEKFYSDLQRLLSIKIPSGYKLSLGLSGGLDSRVLLALLHSSKREFDVHSFGFEYEPDVQIAKDLMHSLNLKSNLLLSDMKDYNLIDFIPDYLSSNELVEPASTFLRLYKLNDPYFEDKVVIDGANGEIYRRQFLNRLYFTGSKAILNKDVKAILSALRFNRADIFSEELVKEMKNGVIDEVENHLNIMPNVKQLGFDNYLDLFNIKTRFVNYFGPEQMRLDSFLVSFMPYINDNLLFNVFSLSLKEKKDSKLFIDLLKQSDKIFKSTPLVKGNITYPFGMSKYQTMLYTKIKNRFVKISDNNPVVHFYNHNKKQIHQCLLDESTLESKIYNRQKITDIINGYYSGNQKLVTELDWLYSFEIFKREMKLHN